MEEEEEEVVELGAESELLGGMEWKEFVGMDSNLPVMNLNNDSVAQDNKEEKEMDEPLEEEPELTINSQMNFWLRSISDLVKYGQKKGNHTLVNLLQKGKALIEEEVITERAKAKQAKIMDFFKKCN